MSLGTRGPVSRHRVVYGGALAGLLTLAAPGSGAGPVVAQDLAARVAAAPDGEVRFQFEVRPGICGNGRWISTTRDAAERRAESRGCDCICEEGPARVELQVSGGVVRDIDTDVGGDWSPTSGPVTDLGMIEPAVASRFLLDLAETAPPGVGRDAIFPATIARGVETWPRLLDIARGTAHRDVRRQAVFWLGQEAGERVTEGLESLIADEGEIAVREHAIFALSQRDESRAVEALMRVGRTSPEPKLRKTAIFWLGQRADDPRVLRFLEEILTGGGR